MTKACSRCVPLSRGGLHGYANVAVSHPSCNVRKHATLIAESL